MRLDSSGAFQERLQVGAVPLASDDNGVCQYLSLVAMRKSVHAVEFRTSGDCT